MPRLVKVKASQMLNQASGFNDDGKLMDAAPVYLEIVKGEKQRGALEILVLHKDCFLSRHSTSMGFSISAICLRSTFCITWDDTFY